MNGVIGKEFIANILVKESDDDNIADIRTEAKVLVLDKVRTESDYEDNVNVDKYVVSVSDQNFVYERKKMEDKIFIIDPSDLIKITGF